MHNYVTYHFKDEAHIRGSISFQRLCHISVEHILKSYRQDYHWFLFTAGDLAESWCCSFSSISLNTCCLKFWYLYPQDLCMTPVMILVYFLTSLKFSYGNDMWMPKLRAAVTQLWLLLGACSALLPEVTACVAEMLEANLWFYLAPTIHSLTF